MLLLTAQQAFLDDCKDLIEDRSRDWYGRMTSCLITYVAGDNPLDSIRLEALTAGRVREWSDWLREKPALVGDANNKQSNGQVLKPGSVNAYIRGARVWLRWMVAGQLSVRQPQSDSPALKQWLAWLEAGNNAPYNLALGLKGVRQQRRRVKFIAPADRDRIMETAADEYLARDYVITRLLAATGCRLQGIAEMRLSALEFRQTHGRRWLHWPQAQILLNEGNRHNWRGRIEIVEKGTKARLVYFGKETVAALFAYLEHERPLMEREARLNLERQLLRSVEEDKAAESEKLRRAMALLPTRLWVGQRGPLTGWGISCLLRRLKKSAGVEASTSAHRWRHGFAKGMIRKGADIKTVSSLLGHSNVQITADLYIEFTDDELDEQHEKFSPID